MIAAAAERGVPLVTVEFGIGDKQPLRMRRPVKEARTRAIPAEVIRDLPRRLNEPDAVYLDLQSDRLQVVMALRLPDSERVAAFVLRLAGRDQRIGHRCHSIIVSAAMIRPEALRVAGSYKRLQGNV